MLGLASVFLLRGLLLFSWRHRSNLNWREPEVESQMNAKTQSRDIYPGLAILAVQLKKSPYNSKDPVVI